MWLQWCEYTCNNWEGADDHTKQADESENGVMFKNFVAFSWLHKWNR